MTRITARIAVELDVSDGDALALSAAQELADMERDGGATAFGPTTDVSELIDATHGSAVDSVALLLVALLGDHAVAGCDTVSVLAQVSGDEGPAKPLWRGRPGSSPAWAQDAGALLRVMNGDLP